MFSYLWSQVTRDNRGGTAEVHTCLGIKDCAVLSLCLRQHTGSSCVPFKFIEATIRSSSSQHWGTFEITCQYRKGRREEINTNLLVLRISPGLAVVKTPGKTRSQNGPMEPGMWFTEWSVCPACTQPCVQSPALHRAGLVAHTYL